MLAGHAPVVAAMRPGILTIITGGSKQKIIVLGGLAEVSESGLTVLAERRDLRSMSSTGPGSPRPINEMQEKLSEKEGSELDHALERLDHFKSIQHELDTTAMH